VAKFHSSWTSTQVALEYDRKWNIFN